jgi:hypothetical protein
LPIGIPPNNGGSKKPLHKGESGMAVLANDLNPIQIKRNGS